MKSVDILHKDLVDVEQSEARLGPLGIVIAHLEKINDRLDKLEARGTHEVVLKETLPQHPSLDKFAIAEVIADQIFAGVEKEKACTFEPTPRPCDHCSMCSSRGF